MKTVTTLIEALERPNVAATTAEPSSALSAAARDRMLGHCGEPLLLADWERACMIHYEVDSAVLQPFVPYPLDLREGRAYVTLLAFTMRGMKPRRGGKLTELLFRPIATHRFLNVRTYARVGNETGIHFLTEYLDNAISVRLGPWPFGLPYRLACIGYQHDRPDDVLSGKVEDPKTGAAFSYRGTVKARGGFAPCARGSLTEWLMERYTAFTARGRFRRLFRVWHAPWPLADATVEVKDDSLIREHHPWFAHARLIGANFSPGLRAVWMGRPHPVGGVHLSRASAKLSGGIADPACARDSRHVRGRIRLRQGFDGQVSDPALQIHTS
jgi:uncharacterized protein